MTASNHSNTIISLSSVTDGITSEISSAHTYDPQSPTFANTNANSMSESKPISPKNKIRPSRNPPVAPATIAHDKQSDNYKVSDVDSYADPLIPSVHSREDLRKAFVAYCEAVPASSGLTSGKFSRLSRDCGLTSHSLTAVDIDVIFTQVDSSKL